MSSALLSLAWSREVFDVAVARREREVELARGQARIVVEHLIKIAQPEKQQAVGIALLDRIILLHHGGEFGHNQNLRVFSFNV